MNSSSTPLIASRLHNLRENLQVLGKETNKLAQEHIVEPVVTIMHDAQQTVHDGAQRAQEAITEKVAVTRKLIARNIADTQENAIRLRDSAATWISANPFASIGVAVIAGMAVALIGRRSES